MQLIDPLSSNEKLIGDENDVFSSLASRVDPINYVITQSRWAQLQNDINVFFLLFMGTCVFIMQLGFPLLEAG
jgi:hypothetical protein